MKKSVFAVSLAACIMLASISPMALLRQYRSPQPTQPSGAGGSQLYAASSDPARFVSVNSQYNVSTGTLYLSYTNWEREPVTLTGGGNLEIEAQWNQYLLMPRRDDAASGLSAVETVVAPGETALFEMDIAQYRPTHISGEELPFQEGSYRVSVEVRRADGNVFAWACLPFRMVAGQVQADQDNVTVTVARAAYSPRVKRIAYQIENHTEGTLWYDGAAKLQRLYGQSRWDDVAGAAQGAGELRQLPPGASDAGVIALPDEHNLGAGTYRVVTPVAGLELASSQFTVPGGDGLRLGIEPVQVSADWFFKDEDEQLVKRGWWTRTQAGRDLWLTAADLYDGGPAPAEIALELESFQRCEEPVGYAKDKLCEITLWDAAGNNVTASLLGTGNATYCLVEDKWYKSGDPHVLERMRAALQVAEISVKGRDH